MQETVLEVKGLAKKFGYRTIFESASFTLQAGSSICLMGKNGAGKSTLLGCLSGLETFDGGEILFYGKPVDENKQKYRSGLFVIDQNFYLYEDFTLRENLSFFYRLHSRVKSSESFPENASEEFGMRRFLDLRVKDFSSGMKRKIRLMLMKWSNARLLLLDEPFNNLDMDTARLLEQLVEDKKKAGAAVLIVTHDPKKGTQMCESVLLLKEKRVLPMSREEWLAKSETESLL